MVPDAHPHFADDYAVCDFLPDQSTRSIFADDYVRSFARPIDVISLLRTTACDLLTNRRDLSLGERKQGMSRTTLLLICFWNSALKEPGCTARDQGELGVAECELFLELCFELACCELDHFRQSTVEIEGEAAKSTFDHEYSEMTQLGPRKKEQWIFFGTLL